MTLSALPRGMKDIDQREMAIRLWVNEKIRNSLRKHGFQIVEPSAVEHLETLEVQAGHDIKNEIYWFKDKSDRSIGLRFDLTVGITRMVASNENMPEPIKVACISNMWRYDEPQFARYRCFYQWDVEIYGSKGAEADAEIISVGIDILESLGFKEFEVRISNRKLIEGFLQSSGVHDQVQMENIFRIIDKKRKISDEQFVKELKKYRVDDKQVQRIVNFINNVGKPASLLKQIKESLPHNEKVKEGLDELIKLVYLLQIRNKVKHCVLDMSIVRGIGYYTGNVVECFDKGNEEIGAIWAGGRYDNLSKLYGRGRPAVGIAGGVERMILSLERSKLLPEGLAQTPMIFVASVNEEVKEGAFEIVDALRNENISTEFDLKDRSLGKQLEYANRMGIPYVLIVGQKELKAKKFTLKLMKENKEEHVTIDQLMRKLKKLDT